MLRAALLILLAGSAALAGCLQTPLPAPRDAAPAPPVDLHKELLNVSMPGGNSSAVVALDVPADLWVPWKRTVDGQGNLDDPEWTVCILFRPSGMGEGNRARVGVLQLEGTELASATPAYPRFREFQDDPHGCVLFVYTQNHATGIRAAAPRDVRLVLLVAAFWGTEAPLRPFSFTLGIGARPCGQAVSFFPDFYCGPSATRPAEPLQRGPAARAAFATEAWFCAGEGSSDALGIDQACGGFTVDDRRQRAGDLSVGRLEASRAAGLAIPHVTYVAAVSSAATVTTDRARSGTSSPAGVNRLRLEGGFGGARLALDCTRPAADGPIEFLLGWSAGPADLHATWDSQGTTSFTVESIEIPLDLARLGWTLKPAAAADSLAGASLPTGDTPCAA